MTRHAIEPTTVAIADISAHKLNPKRHGKRQIAELARSLERFGQRRLAVVRRDGMVLEAGHAMVEAARSLGWTEIQCLIVDDDDSTAVGYLLADNRLAELDVGWDPDLLDRCLEATVDPIGWPAIEDVETSCDISSSEQEEPLVGIRHVMPGERWIVGDQEIFCGDNSGSGISRADTLIYDPPWDMATTAVAADTVLAFCDGHRAGQVIAELGSPRWVFAWDCVSSWFVPGQPLRRSKLCLWYGGCDYNASAHIIPRSQTTQAREVTNTRGSYVYRPHPDGVRLSDVYVEPITTVHNGHSHSKPVQWIACLIANCSDGVVFDPYAGTGTTAVACAMIGRSSISYEIDPAIASIAIANVEAATGVVAVRR